MSIIQIGGLGQATPAMQHTIKKNAVGMARAWTKKRSKGSKKKARAVKTVRKVAGAVRKAKKTAKRLVKGSAAAKAYMKKIRNMRK